MPRMGLIVALVLVVAACSGDDGTTDVSILPVESTLAAETTTTITGTEQTTTTAAAQTTTTVAETTTTAAETTTTMSDGPECLTIWSEEFVQSVLGDNWGFMDATLDGSGCAFTAIPASNVLSFREGGQAEYDAAKTGAGATGGLTDDLGICDASYSVDIGGAILIVEALDLDGGRIYNATISGVEDPVAAATTFLGAACA